MMYKPQWLRAMAAVVLIAAYVAGAALTWNRWGDLIIDTGRELDTPRQLAEGRMLYRDVRYWYGPFAPYLNAVLYQIAGLSVRTLTMAGLVSAALLVWAGYRIVRMFTGRAAAVAGCVAIIFANIFGHYYPLNIFNFILPYSFPATYGMVAAVGGLLALLRHVYKKRAVDFWLACLALAIAALCKLEVLFALGISHLVFLAMVLIKRRWKMYYLLGYVSAIAIAALVYGFFYAQIGGQLWDDNLFMKGNVAASGFALLHSGFQDIPGSLREIAWSMAGYVACFVLMYAISRLGSISSSAELYYVVAFGCVAVCAGIVYFLGPFKVLRALPLALLAMFLVHFAMAIRRRDGSEQMQLALAIVSAFGLTSLARIILKSGAEHYGFYLSVPAMLGGTILWTRELPGVIGRLRGAGGPAYVCGVFILLALGGMHLLVTHQNALRFYGPHSPRITTSTGIMPIMGLYGGSVDRAINDLGEQAKGASLAVIPEGAAMTFLAGARNPLGVHTFTPLDFCGAYDEPAMILRFDAAKPDFIVVNSRDVREYGKRGIGRDYGEALMQWVAAHYGVLQRYQTPYFEVVILKRKT